MADPNLQQLAAEAKSSMALLKYLPLPPDAMTAAVSTVQQAHSAEPWFARGAALVFCQVTRQPRPQWSIALCQLLILITNFHQEELACMSSEMQRQESSLTLLVRWCQKEK